MIDWTDDIQDYEYPEPDDADDEATETMLCPECHESIYTESVACPNCGFLLTEESRRAHDRPKWWTWVVALIILSFVVTYLLY
jgi:uncharacterized paraquat-inducible protein A